MRHYIFCIFLLTAIGTQAQQVNPVPDYVFRNQMSVGRNAVTDTAAYMSIGPRYGANKGLMPPIVSDTAAITGVKRNGLLIFSVQRNNFQYWDSINSRWTSITANVDTTVISTRAWRKKGDDSLGAVIATRTDTTLLSTRAWRQKGLDSLAALEIDGSGTVNYVPKFTASRTLGNSLIFDNGTSIGINNTSPTNAMTIGASSATTVRMNLASTTRNQIAAASGASLEFFEGINERMRIFANGRVGINTTTDAGYQFDVAGSIRNTTGAAFATSSGNVGIGTTSPSARLHVFGTPESEGDAHGQIIARSTQAFNATPRAGIIFQITQDSGGTGAYVGSIFSQKENVGDGDRRSSMIFSTRAASGTTSERMRIFANGRVGINTTTDAGYQFDVAGSIRNTTGAAFATSSGNVGIGTASPSSVLHMNGGTGLAHFRISEATTTRGFLGAANGVISGYTNELALRAELGLILSGAGNAVSAYINSSGGELIIANGNTDLGDYKLQVNGNIYTSGGGVMAASSGEILMGTTVDAGDFRLQVNGNANFRDDVLIDTNLRVNRHISLDQTPKAWALGNAIEGPQGSTLFVAGGGVQTLANIYYDGSYKYSTSNPGAAMFLLQSGITFATYGSGTANGALTGANEMIYAGGELRVGLADQGTFKLQVADKSYFADEVQIASTTDLGNYKLQVTGEAIITAGIRTDAPSGGTAATWKLGTVATVTPTSPNRTIEVEIGGTTYYIHAKTTND